MSLYTRARKHIDMNRVKELREEKLKEKKIADILRQQDEILIEMKKIEIKEDPKYSNWRREINEDVSEITEDMTTASLGMINLPGAPDTIQTSLPSTTLSSADNTLESLLERKVSKYLMHPEQIQLQLLSLVLLVLKQLVVLT